MTGSENLMLLQKLLVKPRILQPGQFYSGLDCHIHTSLFNSLWWINFSLKWSLIASFARCVSFLKCSIWSIHNSFFTIVFSFFFKTEFAYSCVHINEQKLSYVIIWACNRKNCIDSERCLTCSQRDIGCFNFFVYICLVHWIGFLSCNIMEMKCCT